MVLSRSAPPAGSAFNGYPPPPDPIASEPGKTAGRLLADGCYLLDYDPNGGPGTACVGTLRVDSKAGQTLISGDLYQRPAADGMAQTALAPLPNIAAGIPVFPIRSCRHYLRATQLRAIDGGFDLEFELRALKLGTVVSSAGETFNTSEFLSPVTFTARMAADAAEPEKCFAGPVTAGDGAAAGRLSLHWVSPFLRKATIEMDRVARLPLPLDNGEGESWRTVFETVGWDITLRISDSDIEEPDGQFWSGAEAHATMLARRNCSDLDREWRYYLLAVRRIDALLHTSDPANGERGYMFDEMAADTDKVPREGVMVAAEWLIPSERRWGLLQGKRAAETVTYFRTAVHEFGHAMGLKHNAADNGFMNPTDAVADRSLATPDTPFPKNLQWSYHPADETRLRHWPDFVVRPGGHIGLAEGEPLPAVKADQLRLDVTLDTASVPWGVPVRVELALTNTGEQPVAAPDDLSLKSEFVRGQVLDPGGTLRSFAPLAMSEFQEPLPLLEPGQSVAGSLSLLRGGQGALFPVPGDHTIIVQVRWQGDTGDVVATGESRVTITPPVDAAHADAARKLLATPDTLLVLALGGDHLSEANDAIAAALADKTLRPHFAGIEARRLATGFFKRKPDFQAAAALIDDSTVLSPAEFNKLAGIAGAHPNDEGAQRLAAALNKSAMKRRPGEQIDVEAKAI